MNSIRYIPHKINTRFYACRLYSSNNWSVEQVTRRYHISKASLMRWMKRFDGTKESLMDKPKTPHSKHPNSHTESELKSIKNLLRRNPTISTIELYGKLKRNYGYKRHPASLFRYLRKQGIILDANQPIKKKGVRNNKYDTPSDIGGKWQMDVKYVPMGCKVDNLPSDKRYYQYTVIDEASRERFLYWYDEKTISNTIDFIYRAFKFFGYYPKIIQTDNGTEFAYNTKSSQVHPLKIELDELGITHQKIRPRTPEHNGKVERSHRNDNQRFYKFLSFYSLEDLNYQGKLYLKRSNNIPMSVLNYRTPKEQRKYISEKL